jgi:hypothetical protein
MAFQPNGKLVALNRSFLVRFDQTPELDATFSENGTLDVPVSQPQAVVCQGNGSILVSGESSNYGFSIARILADGNPPTDITASPAEIAENLPSGTLVATLATTDLDAGDSSLYSLVSGTGDADNASFSITDDQLRTAATLDFEHGETRSIRIRVVDSGQSIFEKVVSIAVLDDLSEDIDEDGLDQAQEKFYGSSDFSKDSDEDGIDDFVEVYTYHSLARFEGFRRRRDRRRK